MELIQKSIFEGIAFFGDNLLSTLLEASGEMGGGFLCSLLQLSGEMNLKSLQKDTINAAQVQEKLLLEILHLQKDTEYGKRYHFANIPSVDVFCQRHPLTTYENYRFIVDEIARIGNYTQLVAEPISFFQETSGTTGKAKLIPRTNRLSWSFLKSSQAIEAITEYYFRKSNIPVLKRRGLGLVNALPVKLTQSGIPRGTGTSGGINQSFKSSKLVQSIIRLKFSSPPSIFLVSNTESAYYCHLLFGLLESDLTFISANFAANVWEGIQILEEKWQQLVRDIQLGQINETVDLERNVRDELCRLLKPNPERAKVLQTEFEKGMEGILSRIWPQLHYIQCITSGSMQVYLENLKYYAGRTPFYSGGYGASEAWIGVNLQPEREPPVYVITPHSAFFEFIKVTKIDTDNPATIKLTSLQVGERYEIVVTTVAGLYRYRMGDIIRCVGYYNQSPIVEFLYRRGTLLNLAGEKVSEETIWQALNKAIKMLGSDYRITDYTTRVEVSSRPWKYVVYVELSSKLPDNFQNLCFLEEQLEQNIFDLNELYRKVRGTKSIDRLKIKVVDRGSFRDLKNKIILQKSTENQFKMPRLLNTSSLIDFLENKVVLETGDYK